MNNSLLSKYLALINVVILYSSKLNSIFFKQKNPMGTRIWKILSLEIANYWVQITVQPYQRNTKINLSFVVFSKISPLVQQRFVLWKYRLDETSTHKKSIYKNSSFMPWVHMIWQNKSD